MLLQQLQLSNFRIIESARLSDLAAVNLISGRNGSGKTSLLEAIHVLGHGRSFRTRKWQRLVRYDAAERVGRQVRTRSWSLQCSCSYTVSRGS